ncbi:TerB family tellurite resistance protein [Sporolactobacillus spathodeae]
MHFLLVSILPAILASAMASSRGRSAIGWFVLGLIFSYFAPIVLLLLPATSSRRIFPGKGMDGAHMNWRQKTSHPCPYCGNDCIFDDIPGNWTCPNCGNTFTYSSDGHVYKIRDDQVLPQVEWIVKLFAKLAKQDGVVTENEIHQVDAIVRQSFQPSREQLHQIMAVFNEARYSAETFDTIAENLYFSVGGRSDILIDTLTALLAIGYADGTLRSEEDALIRQAARIFRMEADYEALKSRFNGSSASGNTEQSLETCYHTLNCSPNDSLDTIKKHYRQLIKENHPDRLVSRGASREAVQEANVRVAAIKKAYEQILAARNE